MTLSGFSGNNQRQFSVLSGPARLAGAKLPFISLLCFGTFRTRKEIV